MTHYYQHVYLNTFGQQDAAGNAMELVHLELRHSNGLTRFNADKLLKEKIPIVLAIEANSVSAFSTMF